MNPDRFLRRLHLYLALALAPWFAMYGTSALFLAHQGFGEQLGRRLAGAGYVEWTPRFEVTHADPIEAGASPAELRAFAGRALAAHGIDCSYDARFVDASQVGVYCFTTFRAVRLTYDLDSRVLRAEDRHLRVDSVLATLHARAGFRQDSAGADLWALVVDGVAVSLLLWAGTGLWMWWRRPRGRATGGLVLGAGSAAFLFFLLGL